MIIEISCSNDDNELPEHYGYYDSIEAAEMALQQIEEDIKNA